MTHDETPDLSAVLRQLAALATTAALPLRVVVECGGRRVEWSAGRAEPPPAGRGAPGAAPATTPDPDWRWLSPLEEAVVRTLEGGETLSRERIAEAAGESPLGRIRGVLSNLVERRILETASGAGYYLTRPPGQARTGRAGQ